MRPLVTATLLTFGLTAAAGLVAADPKPSPGDTKKVPPIRAKVTLTASIYSFTGVGPGIAVGGGVAGAAGGAANFGIGKNLGGGNANLGGAGQMGQVQNLGVGGGVFGVAGGAGIVGGAGAFGGAGAVGGGFGGNLGGFAMGGGQMNPKTMTTDLYLNIGTDSGKTVILAHVPVGKALDFQKAVLQNVGWVLAPKPPAFAFTGRLTTEDEEKLFPNGAPLLKGPDSLEVGEKDKKKKVVLVVETVGRVDKLTKDRYPPQGSAAVEGIPVCAKDDLKLLDTETLAFQSEPVPVIVPGKKHDDATKAAKKVKAVGTFATSEGNLRLQETAEIKVVEKK